MSNRRCSVTQASPDPDKPSFKVEDSTIPEEVSAEEVLLKVLVCGVCASDCFPVMGVFGDRYPTVPGHEVIGKVVKAGAGAVAQSFGEGDVVGVGWHGGQCLTCEACTDGDFVCCENHAVTGVHLDGGYQEYMVAPANVLARVPDGMSPIDAAPLMCAGVTVFNSLRGVAARAKATVPGIVAVIGVGGLGHLAISYAVKCGYTVVAVSRGPSKKEHALELGASHHIDSAAEDVSAALLALGGANMILCTASTSQAMGGCVDGLCRNGTLVILGASPEPIPVNPIQLISKRRSVVGWPFGTGRDSQDAMEFAQQHNIKPKTVVFEGIDKAPEAYAAMRSGEYRVVIKVASDE